MKKNTLIICLLLSVNCFSQLNIVPMPAEVKMGKGFCVLKEPIGFLLIDYSEGDKMENDGEEFFQEYLKKEYGFKKFVSGDTHSYGLPTEIFYVREEKVKPKGYYELEVKGNKIYIKGTSLGKFYAFQTLRQLIVSNRQIIRILVFIKNYCNCLASAAFVVNTILHFLISILQPWSSVRCQ